MELGLMRLSIFQQFFFFLFDAFVTPWSNVGQILCQDRKLIWLKNKKNLLKSCFFFFFLFQLLEKN